MYSAFGVDHGYDAEIEKGILSAIGGGMAGQAAKLAPKVMKPSVGMRSAGATQGGLMGGAKKAIGASGMGIGTGLRRAAGAMAAKPKLAGGLAVGGAGAGTAGAGFAAGRMGGDNKKLSQYR